MSAQPRVHRIPYSTNVERVSLAFAHKDVAVTWIDVDPADRSSVRDLSGQELVPVLQAPDGTVVTDSTAILWWLEAEHPDPPLWPSDPARRAQTDIALQWFDEVWKGPPNAIDAERARERPDADGIAAAFARIDGWLAWLEALLDGRAFLLGDELGVLDVCAFPFLKFGTVDPLPGDDEPFHPILAEALRAVRGGSYPALAAWIARVDALPRA